MKKINYFPLFLIIQSLTGCVPNGITTKNGFAPDANSPIDPSFIKNDLNNPNNARFELSNLCGHLVEKTDKGFIPLNISAYPSGGAPTLVTPSQAQQTDFQSLYDQTNAGKVAIAYGPGSGSFDISGEDKLQVSINTVAYCSASSVDKNSAKNAADALSLLLFDPKNIFYVTFASYSQMAVNQLHSISANEQLAATPIVNFGGQNFSQTSQTFYKNYVSLDVTPINLVTIASAGSTVQEVTTPMTPVDKTEIPSQPSQSVPSNLKTTVAPIENKTVSPTDFAQSLQSAKQITSVIVK